MYPRVVRWAFERLYRELAWAYDSVAWLVSRGLWRRWALSALPLLQGRVIELGFGTGHIQLARAALPDQLTLGLDASPQMARRTARRLRRAGHHPRLIRGIAQQLPLLTASADTILATFPTDYIADPRTSAEIRRVLAPGGRLIIIAGAQFRHDGLYERLVDLAYRLTLQASVRRPPPIDARQDDLQIAGIALERRLVEVGPSQVLVLIGDDQGSSRRDDPWSSP